MCHWGKFPWTIWGLSQSGCWRPAPRRQWSAIIYQLLNFYICGGIRILQLFTSSAWALTLRGILNSTRPSLLKKTALSVPDLFAMTKICQNSSELAPFKVGLLFSFFGYLRISNVAPDKVLDWDPSRHTDWSDITASDEGIVISLKWTKTRQHSPHPAAIPMPAVDNSILCPLRAWTFWVAWA